MHRLVLAGTAPDAFSGDPDDFLAALDAHADELRRFVAEQGVQTNETQRCVALLPAFLTIARETGLPLDLLELGPSAGLNLLFDHYRYTYAEGTWATPRRLLGLEAVERGRVPASLLGPAPSRYAAAVASTCSRSTPRPRWALLLRAFIWAGLDSRVARLDAAIETLARTEMQPELIRGNYVDLLPDLLAACPADVVTVVFQTASTAYLTGAAAPGCVPRSTMRAPRGRRCAWISTRAREEQDSRDDSWELKLASGPVQAGSWPTSTTTATGSTGSSRDQLEGQPEAEAGAGCCNGRRNATRPGCSPARERISATRRSRPGSTLSSC